MSPPNLFEPVPEALSEVTEPIVTGSAVRIERIVSHGQASPPDFWYDQDEHEWVTVLRGRARLAFADGTPDVEMTAGDHVLIPAHQRHRVAWTDPATATVWLAVFYRS